MTELIEPRKPELRALCERYRVERLALFGSALRDDFVPKHSGLDLSVEFASMALQEHAEPFFGLPEDLEDVFGRRVDLVEIGAVRNPYLRRGIEAGQETLDAVA